jgi:hypothetical protein
MKQDRGATFMNKLSMTVALAMLVTFVSSVQAQITIQVAEVQNGVAVVKGKGAERGAPITWEGNLVTTANRNNGGFSFTGNVPADCIGALSDGVTTGTVQILGCTPGAETTIGVLKTGQTLCETATNTLAPCPGYPAGQDGELRKGAARSYTVNALTITDNTTGLEWEKLCNDTVTPTCPVINDVDSWYEWTQAFQKIADLNAANFAGHNDWRLPNINELKTLVDYGKVGPAVDNVFRTGNDGTGDSWTKTSDYWSSTTSPEDPTGAWHVYFYRGSVDWFPKYAGYYVRAVRGGS